MLMGLLNRLEAKQHAIIAGKPLADEVVAPAWGQSQTLQAPAPPLRDAAKGGAAPKKVGIAPPRKKADALDGLIDSMLGP